MTLLHEKLVDGEYLGEAPDKMILLGAGLARTLEAKVGDEIVVVTQAADGSMGNALFRVGGILKTGSVAADRSRALVHLRDLQELLVLDGRVHEVAVLAKALDGAAPLAAGAKRALDGRGLLVRTWAQVNPEVAKMLELQSVSAWIILFFVFSVASLGVLNTMLMSVLERTKELGVLRALGLRPRQVVALVLCESLLLASVAAVGGTALGLLADGYLVIYGLDLTRFIGDFSFGGIAFSPVLRGEVQIGRIGATLVGLFAVTLVASVWPALRAGRLQPVEAMRQE
ncbi:MAG: ABC transporter permease [Myxococcales bacterium]